MSRWERKAFLSDGFVEVSTRTRLRRAMSESSEAERELAAELAEIEVRLEEKEMELRNSKAEVEALKLEHECVKMSTELESLRTWTASVYSMRRLLLIKRVC